MFQTLVWPTSSRLSWEGASWMVAIMLRDET